MNEGSGHPAHVAQAPPSQVQWVMPPPQRRSLLSRLKWVFFGGVVGSMFATCGLDSGAFGTRGPKVGVVEVLGTILESREVVEQLAEYSHDDSIQAVVLRIDSPGGSVGPSQEIYDAIRKTAQVKPVVASMGSVAASGGYWIALGADEIFANAGTMTGSIGVIIQTPDLSKLAEMLKFDMRTYKSGDHKDIGNPLRPSTPGDDKIFQALVDDVYDQFLSLTAERRQMDIDKVRPLADGRIMTGRIAKASGLIDGLGGLEAAASRAIGLARGGDTTSTSAPDDEAPVLIYPDPPVPSLTELLGVSLSDALKNGVASGVEQSIEKLYVSDAVIR